MSSRKTALVTGASSGIGLAIAHMLGQEDYDITLVARREEKLNQATKELEQQGITVNAVALDLSKTESPKIAVDNHLERFDSLDLLVNNAGFGFGAAVEKLPIDQIDRQISVNLRAMILFYREAVGPLRQSAQKHGSSLVINTSSITGKDGQGWLSVYSATKHAVVGFTEAMNKELGADRIKSCALCPGYVDTPMTEFAHEHVPPTEMMKPQDIAEMCRGLLRLSPACVVPEIQFLRNGQGL